ncbi:30S ribosomal protein S6--L-glutamate ligase [Candidatus Microgenomates bacterium]|nr:30S ribosomal protein S6--L-glutamate ligase [Candidatus Microgenomates bacterium]
MKIAILSKGISNYSTVRLAKAARKRGHKPMVLDYTQCYMEIEEHKPNVHYAGKAMKGLDAIIPRVAARYTSYGSAVVRQFEMTKVFTTASSIAIVRSRDKLRTLQLLAREGIAIPKTAFASQARDAEDLIEQVGGAPLIVKLVESTHGQGVVIAETSKAARSVIQAFYSIGAAILVQEFIREAEGSDIRCIVVGGEVIAAMVRQGLSEDFRSNIHLGGIGKPIEVTKKETRLAVRAARKLGLDIAGVDIIRSHRGPLIIEVNSSPGLEGIEKATKQDVAGAIIGYIEKNVGRKPKKDIVGA